MGNSVSGYSAELLEEVERDFLSFLETSRFIGEGVRGVRDADFMSTSRYQEFNENCGGVGMSYLGKAIESLMRGRMIRFEDGFYCVGR